MRNFKIVALALVIIIIVMFPTCSAQNNYVRGVLSFQNGEYDKAIIALEKAKKGPTKYPSIYFYLGQCYEHTGENSLAKQNYEEVVRRIESDASYLKDPNLQSEFQEAKNKVDYL